MGLDRCTDSWRAIRFVLILFFSAFWVFPVFAAREKDSRSNKECVTHYDKNKDYFPEPLQIEYAENFQVTYHKHYKVVKVAAPWKTGGETFEYVLVQCGAPTPKGFANAQFVSVPAQSMVVLSTTYFTFMEQLNLLDRLIGIANFQQVNSSSVLELIEQKKVVEVGRNVDLNLEFILQLNPDIIMTYGTGNPYRDGYAPLLKFGIRVGVFAEYMESTPLARAEWLKFMALFFNRETEANEVFQEITTQYHATVRLAQNVTKKPTVFTGASREGTWYMPGGQSYVAAFLQDAGAQYLWSDDSHRGSLALDFEAVLKKASDADYWLNPGLWKTLQDGLADDSRYQFFSAFHKKNVYNNNALLNPYGGNDYWERGVANPHLVLADLIKIFHPHLLPDHQLIWYRHLQ